MVRYPHEATFNALDHKCLLITTRPEDLLPAVGEVVAELTEVAWVTSPDLPTSEVSRLTRLAQFADITAPASPVLIDYLSAALWAADLTDGVVDPTGDGTSQAMDRIEIGTGTVTLPAGCTLDLRSTASAHAADLLSRRLAAQYPEGGFLLSVDGDIAVSGTCPEGGWQIPVTAGSGRTVQLVSTATAALANSTGATTPGAARGNRNHRPIWTQVTVAARTALEAAAWASASVLLGERAPAWLGDHGIAARLERRTGTTRFTTGWPQAHLAVA